MAPRMPESQQAFLARLATAGDQKHVGFGSPHFTHVACNEGDAWRVRRLVLDPAKIEAYRREHASFMPEHAEMLSEPGPDVVFEAPTLTALVAELRRASWPLR